MVAGVFWYYGVQFLQISEAITIVMTNPLLTTILSHFILKEKIGKVEIISTLIGFTGIMFITKPPFLTNLFQNENQIQNQQNNNSIKIEYYIGCLFCFMASIGRTGSQICYRLIGKQVNTIILSNYYSFFCILAGSVLLIQDTDPSSPIDKNKIKTPYELLALILMGIFQLFAHITSQKSYVLEKATKISVISYFQIVFGYLFDIFIFKSKIDYYSLMGSFLILSAVITLFLNKLIHSQDNQVQQQQQQIQQQYPKNNQNNNKHST